MRRSLTMAALLVAAVGLVADADAGRVRTNPKLTVSPEGHPVFHDKVGVGPLARRGALVTTVNAALIKTKARLGHTQKKTSTLPAALPVLGTTAVGTLTHGRHTTAETLDRVTDFEVRTEVDGASGREERTTPLHGPTQLVRTGGGPDDLANHTTLERPGSTLASGRGAIARFAESDHAPALRDRMSGRDVQLEERQTADGRIYDVRAGAERATRTTTFVEPGRVESRGAVVRKGRVVQTDHLLIQPLEKNGRFAGTVARHTVETFRRDGSPKRRSVTVVAEGERVHSSRRVRRDGE